MPVFFLLPLFAPHGPERWGYRPVELPVFRHFQQIEIPGPVVTVVSGQVLIEGTELGRVDDISKSPEHVIARLTEALRWINRNHQQLHPGQPDIQDIYIEADRETPYAVLRKVIHTASLSGCARFHFVVVVDRDLKVE